jgi:hypothetical protein
VPFLRKSHSLTIEPGLAEWMSASLRRKRSTQTGESGGGGSHKLNLRTPVISEEGFEIVKNELPGLNTIAKKTRRDSVMNGNGGAKTGEYRTRKFSWEETDDRDTAEYISNRLTKNLLMRLYKTDSVDCDLLPNLTDFEFFIKNLQYTDFVQAYHESIDHAKLKKITASLMLGGSTGTSISTALSSTSIYLSHASTGQLPTPPSSKASAVFSGLTGRSVKGGELRSLNNSTWVRYENIIIVYHYLSEPDIK